MDIANILFFAAQQVIRVTFAWFQEVDTGVVTFDVLIWIWQIYFFAAQQVIRVTFAWFQEVDTTLLMDNGLLWNTRNEYTEKRLLDGFGRIKYSKK